MKHDLSFVEYLDLYDANRKPLGITVKRGDPIPEGSYSLGVQAWHRRKDGKYLISRRSDWMPVLPLYWETTGGSVSAGEDGDTGVLRECWEEMALPYRLEEGRKLMTKVRRRDIVDVWVFQCEYEPDLDKAPTDEVCETKWVDLAEIGKLYEQGCFVPSIYPMYQQICEWEAEGKMEELLK